MANNPLLNELIEEKVYPIVDSIKGFFGSFGIADRLSQPGSNTGSPTRSGSSVAASPSYIDARASLQSGVTIPERYLVSSNLPPYVPPRSFSPPADVGFHVNGQSTSSVAVSTTPISRPAPAVAAVAAVATPSTAVEGTPQSHDNASSTHSTPNHVTTGNHRAPGAPVSVAGGLNQQTARTGSFHGDVSRSAKARLGNPPLRAAASVDSTGILRSLGAAGPEAHSSTRQSNFSSLSSQFRQTFAERGTAGSTQSNGGGNSAASSIDHHDGDQTETPSTPNNRASISGTSGSAADDSGDAYAAALAVSAGADKLGRLQFSVSYDFDAQTLTVKIIKAESLAAKDLSGTSDPYVKISLLPDKKHTLTTNIKRKNLNPRWNEVFAFEGFPYNKVVMKTLHLLVLDYDRFSRDDPIGEVCLPLGDLDLATGLTMWKTLLPCKGAVGKLGVLQLSLCYQPTDESITVEIIKARDLKAKDINGLSDPYVKIWMTHEGKKIEKKKTSVKEKNLNPIFNETFLFTVPYERIRQTSLVVSVMDYDRMGRNEAIGQLVLGPKSGPIEMKHWNEMFAKTRQPVTQWHLLKDFG